MLKMNFISTVSVQNPYQYIKFVRNWNKNEEIEKWQLKRKDSKTAF